MFSIVSNKARRLLYLQFVFLTAYDWSLSFSFSPFSLAAASAVVLIITDLKNIRLTCQALWRQKLLKIILFLSIYMLLSSLLINKEYSFSKVVFSFQWFLILLTYSNLFYTKSKRFIRIALLLIAFSFALNTLTYIPTLFNLDWVMPLVKSRIPAHFYAARYGALLVVILAYWYKVTHSKTSFTILMTILLLTFMTGGRNQSFAALIVTIFILRSKFFTFLFLPLIIYIMFSYGSANEEYSQVTNRYTRIVNRTGDLSEIEFRQEHIEIALISLKESPIIGYGFGSWFDVSESITGETQYLTVHNSYMHILVELGAIGMLLFIILIVSLTRRTGGEMFSLNPIQASASISLYMLISLLIMGIAHSLIVITYITPMILGMRAGSLVRLRNY